MKIPLKAYWVEYTHAMWLFNVDKHIYIEYMLSPGNLLIRRLNHPILAQHIQHWYEDLYDNYET